MNGRVDGRQHMELMNIHFLPHSSSWMEAASSSSSASSRQLASVVAHECHLLGEIIYFILFYFILFYFI